MRLGAWEGGNWYETWPRNVSLSTRLAERHFGEFGGLQAWQLLEEAGAQLFTKKEVRTNGAGGKRAWSRLKKVPKEVRRARFVVFFV